LDQGLDSWCSQPEERKEKESAKGGTPLRWTGTFKLKRLEEGRAEEAKKAREKFGWGKRSEFD